MRSREQYDSDWKFGYDDAVGGLSHRGGEYVLMFSEGYIEYTRGYFVGWLSTGRALPWSGPPLDAPEWKGALGDPVWLKWVVEGYPLPTAPWFFGEELPFVDDWKGLGE